MVRLQPGDSAVDFMLLAREDLLHLNAGDFGHQVVQLIVGVEEEDQIGILVVPHKLNMLDARIRTGTPQIDVADLIQVYLLDCQDDDVVLAGVDLAVGGQLHSLVGSQFALVVVQLQDAVVAIDFDLVQELLIFECECFDLEGFVPLWLLHHFYIYINNSGTPIQQNLPIVGMNRKYKQIITYSKIMKKKKQTGQIEEIPNSAIFSNSQQKMEEEPYHAEEEHDGQFEDEYEDEFDQEEGWVSDSQSEGEDNTIQSQQGNLNKNNNKKQKPEVFIGTKKNLKKGEVLDFDNNAYDMLHRLNNEWPSLSIDFVCQDSPFANKSLPFVPMKKYPYEVYTVQGSSNNTPKNCVYLTKWIKLHKTKYDDDPDIEGDSEDEDLANDQEPEIIAQEIETTYSINRIRSLLHSPIVAFWNDQGELHIMDLTKNYEKLKNNIGTKKKESVNQIVLHSHTEGFALNWNPHKIGQLASGNMAGHVQIFDNNESYTSWSRSGLYTYHKGSVEDIAYSPNEPTVFASCSSDGTLQIVDMRVGDFKKSQLLIKAHEKDVNVCDWSRSAPNLIVTGSDDCSVKVWDLRKQKQKGQAEELLSFNWHTEPITSIRFQPNEESVIAVASEDNSISIWDMAMENEEQDPQIPNQLMFIHQGQEEIKQIAFHPMYFEMIVSSASDGINLFKPSYEMPQEQGDMKEDLKKPPIREEDLDEYIERMNKRAG